MGGRGCAGWRGINGGGWDNCESIINKIYLKKEVLKGYVKEKNNANSKDEQKNTMKDYVLPSWTP